MWVRIKRNLNISPTSLGQPLSLHPFHSPLAIWNKRRGFVLPLLNGVTLGHSFSTGREFSTIQAKDFEFTHRYVPLHPRVSDDKGELVVQGNRWAFFLCSFSFASILELRYRVHLWPPPVPPRGTRHESTRSRNIEISHGMITYNTGNALIQYDPVLQTSAMILDLSNIGASVSCFLCLEEMIVVACTPSSDKNTQELLFSFEPRLSSMVRLNMELTGNPVSRICASSLKSDETLVVALDGTGAIAGAFVALTKLGKVVAVDIPQDARCSYMDNGEYFLRAVLNEVMLCKNAVGNSAKHSVPKPLAGTREILDSLAAHEDEGSSDGCSDLITWRRKIGESNIDPSHLCVAQQASPKTPLVLFTKYKFNEGSLSWAPNEGSIRAIGSSKDGKRVYISILNDTNPVNDSKPEQHLLFEFTVKKDLPQGHKAPEALVSQYSLGDVQGKAQRKLIRQRQSAERQKRFELNRLGNSEQK